MKNLLPAFICLITLSACKPNKMVTSSDDLSALKTHSKKFVGKPLSYFLHQVQPPFKAVVGTPRIENAGFFSFYLHEYKDVQRAKKTEKPLPVVMVFVDGSFDFKVRQGFPYPADFESKYGNLKIVKLVVLDDFSSQ